MATSHLISIDEYLSSSYEPDVDYVDGRIEERHVGETDHSKLQGQLYFMLRLREEDWHLLPLTEVRVQVSPTRFRVPDVCVVREEDADNPIITQPRFSAWKSCRQAEASQRSVSAPRTSSTWEFPKSGYSIRQPRLCLSACPIQ